MRGTLFKLAPLLLLAACTTTQGIHTEFVDRPILTTQKCVKKSDIPEQPKSLKDTPVPSDLETALAKALAKISEWTRYGHKTDEILKNCS